MPLKWMSSIVVAAGLLAGCTTDDAARPQTMTLGGSELAAMVENLPSTRLNDPFIQAGVEHLRQGDYVAASDGFNRALKFDPANPNLHFLNALTYHLRAVTGDASQFDFAKAGYDLALRYDPGNFWAAYLQGQIMVREQRYRRAQDAFAYALLYAPDNIDILKALASASYFAQDLNAATQAIERAAELAPDDREVLYNRVLINAAAGRFGDAEQELAVYRVEGDRKSNFRVAHLTQRLNDWKRFHANKAYLQTAQATPNTATDATATATAATAAKKADPKMALIDVVIIRSEEIHITNKGVNLLSGLTATLGGTTLKFAQTNQLRGAGPTTSTLTWAPTLSIASTAYSLNIFNDNYDRNEVLARPTLIALDGEKSTFFSGAVWHIALDGTYGSEGTVDDVKVGINLAVTPRFIDDDKVQVAVTASRAFIESVDSNTSFGSTPVAQTTDTEVGANVALEFGETLVLSGLSERETEKLNDGVPLLQDLPVIQYLFSHQNTLDFTKSVIILLTPRKPRYTYANGVEKLEPEFEHDTKQPHLKELEKREIWFQPASNLDAVFYHLHQGSFFSEFRQGDLTVERWSEPSRVERMLLRTLQFLYF